MIYDLVATRSEADVAALYTAASVVGLEVSHCERLKCRTFNATPTPRSMLGVFRITGDLIFYKDSRHWEVRARSDAGRVELATLLMTGLRFQAKYGRQPGHITRQRIFRHCVSQRTGERIAYTEVVYRLGVSDLIEAQEATELDLSTLAVANLLSTGAESDDRGDHRASDLLELAGMDPAIADALEATR